MTPRPGRPASDAPSLHFGGNCGFNFCDGRDPVMDVFVLGVQVRDPLVRHFEGHLLFRASGASGRRVTPVHLEHPDLKTDVSNPGDHDDGPNQR